MYEFFIHIIRLTFHTVYLFSAIIHIGFLLTLANLSYILCFGAYLLWYELDRPKTFEPKTYINIILETAVAINVSFLHLLEVGTAGSGYSILGPENPLDFRGNYIQTSLALSVIGSFAICMANDYVESIAKVSQDNTNFFS